MGAAAIPWVAVALTAGGMGIQSSQHDAALRKQNETNREAKKKQDEMNTAMNTPGAREVDPTTTDADALRKKRLNQLRAGLMSTIKTKPQGVQAPGIGLNKKLG